MTPIAADCTCMYNEMGVKSRQHEDLLNQLERAELKAAKETRQRMELEQLTRHG